MQIIHISYSLDRDISNYKLILQKDKLYDYGRKKDKNLTPLLWPNTIENLATAKNNDEKILIIRQLLEKRILNSPVMKINLDAINNYWRLIEAKYFERLSTLMDAPAPDHLDAYSTTVNRCPYSTEGWFFVPFFAADISTQAKVIMHESMHIVFRRRYERQLADRGIGNEGIMDITESMTLLLNWHFRDILVWPETNLKPSTFDLQDTINQMSQQKKPFADILETLINMRLRHNAA